MAKKKTYGFSRGIELTDQLLDKLAKEAEEGFDPKDLVPRARGRPPMGSSAARVFQVRLEPALREALDERAKRDGTTPSELVRRLLRNALEEPAASTRRRRGMPGKL